MKELGYDDFIYDVQQLAEAKTTAFERSSVRFLESCSGTWTTELLWLASSGIRDEESLVVLHEKFLKISLSGLISVFLVVSDQGLGDGHSDSHDLVHSTTALNSNSDAEILKFIGSNDEDWLINLSSHGLWLDKRNWLFVDSDESVSLLAKGNSGSVLLLSESSNLLNLFLFTHISWV